MKRIFFFTLFVLKLNDGKTLPPVIHSYVFCNTNDNVLAECANSNLGNVTTFIQNIVGVTGYQADPHIVIAANFNTTQFKIELDKSKIDPDDIVIFYVNTHGENFKKANDAFPFIHVPDKEILIQTRKLHYYLTKKTPKILITIIESCNGFERIQRQKEFVIEQNISSGTRIDFNDPNLKAKYLKLLSKPLNLLISAGNPGTTTKGNSSGSYFTNCFIKAFNEINRVSKIESLNWNLILRKSRETTVQVVANRYHPIWGYGKIDKITEIVQSGYDIGDSSEADDGLIIEDQNPALRDEKLDICLKKVKVFSKYWFNGQKYHVTVSLANSKRLEIDSVVYFLDVTMPDSIQTVRDKDENFRVRTFTVWGEFQIKGKVYYTDGTTFDVYGEIRFPKNKEEEKLIKDCMN